MAGGVLVMEPVEAAPMDPTTEAADATRESARKEGRRALRDVGVKDHVTVERRLWQAGYAVIRVRSR